MLSINFYKGKKVAVYGLGRSGLSVALALKRGGAIPVCWDDCVKARNNAQNYGLIIKDLTISNNWNSCVLLLLSPGIPYIFPVVSEVVQEAWKHKVPVDNDVGLFFQSYSSKSEHDGSISSKTIAVTGSNGKSTTCALIYHILSQGNEGVQLGGNIGTPLFDLNAASEVGTTIIELSSYQIEVANLLTPDIAVFLNFSPDHLDRHGGIGGYFAAKKRLFQKEESQISIIGVDEKEGLELANDLRKKQSNQVITISNKKKLDYDDWSVFSDGNYLFECKLEKIINKLDIKNLVGLPGIHNLQNICAAYAVCSVLKISLEDILQGLQSYKALPHRTEIIATLNGITFVNDSKATNAASTLNALNTFPNIHWIAGGRGKADGISSLLNHLDSVKKIYLIGESAVDFYTQTSGFSNSICKTLEEAILKAYNNAISGDTILLSPAAASFDQYTNFEERGSHFSRLVKELE